MRSYRGPAAYTAHFYSYQLDSQVDPTESQRTSPDHVGYLRKALWCYFELDRMQNNKSIAMSPATVKEPQPPF